MDGRMVIILKNVKRGEKGTSEAVSFAYIYFSWFSCIPHLIHKPYA